MTRRAGAAVAPAGQLGAVVLLMAISAAGRGRPKLHTGLAERGEPGSLGVGMTAGAGDLLMAAFQRIARRLVLRHSEARRGKARHCVTGRAVRRLPGQRGGARVRIGVAGAAAAECRVLALDPARLVAGGAGDGRMLPREGVAGPAVIEAGAFDHREAPGLMTLTAHRAEFPGVRIGVAGRALLVRHRLEQRQRPACRIGLERQVRIKMTLGTWHLDVGAGERILTPRVIEPRRRFPSGHVVARDAVPIESAAMDIDVTGGALPLQSHPSRRRLRAG
jgi:hypothetical protein